MTLERTWSERLRALKAGVQDIIKGKESELAAATAERDNMKHTLAVSGRDLSLAHVWVLGAGGLPVGDAMCRTRAILNSVSSSHAAECCRLMSLLQLG